MQQKDAERLKSLSVCEKWRRLEALAESTKPEYLKKADGKKA